MHGGQGWPAMPLVSCQHEAMAAPTCARASWARTTPLYLRTELEAERASIVGRAVIHGSSSS